MCSRGRLVLSRNQMDQGDAISLLGGAARPPEDTYSRLHLNECRSFLPASSFSAMVSETAYIAGVEPRALAVRALLHLPRVASYNGWVPKRQAQWELRISAERLLSDVCAARRHVPIGKFQLPDLDFEEIDSSRAIPVITSLHYLRGSRPNSLYFALVDPVGRLPVSLCSISPLQWNCVGNRIRTQHGISQEKVWDVSRVYSIDGAPPNAISFLLSKVRIYVRRNMPSIELLVTAVDPNLGFTGCSYRAANWQQWMTVRARPYLYEDRSYITPRQLRERFGTASLAELQSKYPGIFEKSKVSLLDSMIYCNKVNGETKVVPAQNRPRLHR
jgi:hypothetical protein